MYHYSVFFQYLFKRRKHFFYLIRRRMETERYPQSGKRIPSAEAEGGECRRRLISFRSTRTAA